MRTIERLEILPSYRKWKEIVIDHSNEEDIMRHIGDLYRRTGNKPAALAIGKEMVQRHQNSKESLLFLCKSLLVLDDMDAAVAAWETSFNRLPYILDFTNRTAGDMETEIMLWEQLTRRYPDDAEYKRQLNGVVKQLMTYKDDDWGFIEFFGDEVSGDVPEGVRK